MGEAVGSEDPVTLAELLAILNDDHDDDPEVAHAAHDEALLKFIGIPEVTEAFNSQTKWYS